MKSFEFPPAGAISCSNLRLLVWAGLSVASVIASACGSENAQPTVIPIAAPLSCPECELVEVLDVIDANIVRTSAGEIQMYGAYVLDQPADCAELASERLRSLAGERVRIEPGPANSVRVSDSHYCLYTEEGVSIEEMLVREGLALTWTQDGQHLGWFLFRDAAAKESESGCLWKGYNAFQRGEPSEFRIPGLTYPESSS